MCGRFFYYLDDAVLRAQFGLDGAAALPAAYNLAPSQPIGAIVAGGAGRELRLMRWGLIPAWAKDAAIGYRTINARAETVADKPAFRDAFRRRRCLIPASGYYEWQGERRPRRPCAVRPRDGTPLAFAGLWERWRPPQGSEPITSCAIITTPANNETAHIHPRMPALIAAEDYQTWLQEGDRSLLAPRDDLGLEAYPVGSHVNDPRNDYPALLEHASPNLNRSQ